MRFVLLGLVVLALTVYSVIDCVGGEEQRRKNLPTWLWVTLIVALPVLGALIWLLVSRSAGASGQPAPRRRTGPLAPDDDPAFLADLDRRTRPHPGADSPGGDEATEGDTTGEPGAAETDFESDSDSENGTSGGHKPE
ncbi:PLD nuclease N-terminal domain-containing protein [Ruania halotolerans]|uniref:PLD nuclease N-terminal domain-containing protein n=1 Tax=Ruania halotolerans TaxID=2897773 RepID=UPI001E5B4690|nr:PLD nuclease N-terminal domain-containing protein [Ruania halotolerans]UFU05822.1 PLD nuclease N-terminal domain-containing protein [Ruania halotolerans]